MQSQKNHISTCYNSLPFQTLFLGIILFVSVSRMRWARDFVHRSYHHFLSGPNDRLIPFFIIILRRPASRRPTIRKLVNVNNTIHNNCAPGAHSGLFLVLSFNKNKKKEKRKHLTNKRCLLNFACRIQP